MKRRLILGLLAIFLAGGAGMHGQDVGPEALSTSKPRYPFAMRRAGLSGDVTVAFVVDTQGRVRAPFIAEASHPAFRQSAIDAVMEWKFKPAMVDDKAVNARMRAPIHFRIIGEEENFGWRVIRPRTFSSEVPEAYRWDEAPVLEHFAPPVFPREAMMERRKGKVTVKFVVGPDGLVAGTLTSGKADDTIKAAAAAAVEIFRFTPATQQGVPCGAILHMDFDFKFGSKSDAPVTAEMKRLVKILKSSETAMPELKDLDEVPMAIYQRSPRIPPALAGSPGGGEATIEFVINRNGSAMLPRVVAATELAYGYAAAQAVADWQFAVPLIDGEPTDVRAVIPIKFTGN
ncbi:TonB family protein [Synoicihabitans lomoniglobus]|uniref:TonB family protein n=1 Tax=Synoicihabitans lomoniglobus TaxID=2909285 RepID=A0AAE9ZZT7_9BACT|nr:energy transducer TonB [Opitutaceae bacterium LMO-M01]WED64513.1 TonB family protein [Opitutaceae bacterium LMO-M01]